jgi:hypothetical protein
VTVSISGEYTFTSASTIDTFGIFYNDLFDSSNPSRNLIKYDDDSGNGNQFQIILDLQSARTYILVVTTFSPTTTGYFSISATGPASTVLVALVPPSSK